MQPWGSLGWGGTGESDFWGVCLQIASRCAAAVAVGGARGGAGAGQDLGELRLPPRNAKKGARGPRLWGRSGG